MAQNREPPAFQEYAAAMMAKTDYRLMSLAGRGLLYTMRLECWVNRRLPPDAPRLARVLGFDVAEVAALMPEVRPFFAIDEAGLFCPELEDYREHVNDRRQKQSEGGKQTAAKHKAKRQQVAPERGAGYSHSAKHLMRSVERQHQSRTCCQLSSAGTIWCNGGSLERLRIPSKTGQRVRRVHAKLHPYQSR